MMWKPKKEFFPNIPKVEVCFSLRPEISEHWHLAAKELVEIESLDEWMQNALKELLQGEKVCLDIQDFVSFRSKLHSLPGLRNEKGYLDSPILLDPMPSDITKLFKEACALAIAVETRRKKLLN